MGRRKVSVKQSVADSIAEIAWFLESKGLIKTAEKFADDAYDFFIAMSDLRKSFAPCRETTRFLEGYKCVPYKKKYTIVFLESDEEMIICEFISTKLIYW